MRSCRTDNVVRSSRLCEGLSNGQRIANLAQAAVHLSGFTARKQGSQALSCQAVPLWRPRCCRQWAQGKFAQERNMRRRKVYVRHVGQLVARDVHNHHHWQESAPPDDPTFSRQCPQCRRLTWRYTPRCVHCQLDVRRWRLREVCASAWKRLMAPAARFFR